MAHPPKSANPAGAKFKPYIPDEQIIPEFSLKAIVLGSVFGILFGAATVYLALRAGLTVSASIPIAVLAIWVFKKVAGSTILENNIVQTIGSAGESIAAGVVFTIPALLFLAEGAKFFQYFQIMVLAFVGGILGVLFMIPLRRSLIVKEHGVLPYPEGTACADVLIAGEKGGEMARTVFSGVGVAMIYKTLMSVFGLWKDTPAYVTSKDSQFPNATVNCEITPEYLGVGYIIGPKIASNMVSGGVISWLLLIPLITIIGSKLGAPLAPGWQGKLIGEMTPTEIYRGYARYIGAGAVACAGVITLLRTLPTIIASFKDSLKDLKDIGKKGGDARRRTERDIPITYVVGGSILLALLIAFLPKIPHGPFPGNLLFSLMIVVFGFFFVTVSSRIVGIIGSSSNPISGMTIATLMATCLIFVALGWTGDAYQGVALCVGALVCIAAANAGATSQDLKTGYIVGATPIYQQLGLIIGVLVSVVAAGFTVLKMHEWYAATGGIGGTKLPAPQATLMATIIKGLLAQDLPWGLVFVGIFAAIVIELCGVHSLSWAVGAYLPLSTTMPIFVGGMVKYFVDRVRGKGAESELSSGMLYATGLVAGGSLAGVAIASLNGIDYGDKSLGYETIAEFLNFGGRVWHLGGEQGALGDVIAILCFAFLCYLLWRAAQKELRVEGGK